MPVENLLTPDYLRRTLWTPPRTREPGTLLDEIAAQLAAYGARSWQIGLAAPVLTSAVLEADAAPVRPQAEESPDDPSPEA
jgi:ribonuclease D